MEPQLGRIALTLGVSILVFSIIILPSLEPDSAEFIVTLITMIITSCWLGFIIWSIRREVATLRRMPDRKSQQAQKKEQVE